MECITAPQTPQTGALPMEGMIIEEPPNPQNQALARAEALYEAYRPDEAAGAFERAMEQDPAVKPLAYMGLARCAVDQGAIHEALGYLQALEALDPDYPGLANDLAVIYCRLGMIDLAREAAEEAVAKAPEDPTPLRNLRDIALAQRAYELSVDCCNGILQLEPDDTEAMAFLAAKANEELRANEELEP